jgi:hypothetical protein
MDDPSATAHVREAQDVLLPDLLRAYRAMCDANGSPQHHLDGITESRERVMAWQRGNADRVRVPNSDAYIARKRGED